MSASEIESAVGDYTNQIGDIEPYRGGVLQDLDPLLRRSPKEVPQAPRLSILRGGITSARGADAGIRETVAASLRAWIAERLGSDATAIGVETPFAEMGLDSITAVELTRHLERSLHISVAPTATWDFPNITALAEHAATIAKPAATPDASLDSLSEREMTALLENELRTS